MAKYHITPSGRMMICKAWKQENCWYGGNPHVEAATKEEAQRKMDEILPSWIEKQKQEKAAEEKREQNKKEIQDKIKAFSISEMNKEDLYNRSHEFIKVNSLDEVYDKIEAVSDKEIIREDRYKIAQYNELCGASYYIITYEYSDGEKDVAWIKVGQEKITEYDNGKVLLYASSSDKYNAAASCVLLENNSGLSDWEYAESVLMEQTGYLFGNVQLEKTGNQTYSLSGNKD